VKSNRAVLVLPVKPHGQPHVRFYVVNDGVVLTDTHWGRRIGAWFILMPLALLGASVMIGGLVNIIGGMQHNSTGSHQSSDRMSIGGLFLVLGIIIVASTAALAYATQCHRRFVVRVDFTRRVCVSRSKLYGWTTKRLEIDTDRTVLTLKSAHVTLPVNETTVVSGITQVLAVFTGSLGLLLLLIPRSSRGNSPAARREVLRLSLREDGELRAVITVPDEGAAEQFVLAWDRGMTGRETG